LRVLKTKAPAFWIFCALVVGFARSATCDGAIVDSTSLKTSEVSILQSISVSLDAAGIDVRLGPVSEETERFRLSRAQVASLETLPPPSPELGVDADGFSALFLKSAALSESQIDTVLVAVGEPVNPDSKTVDAFAIEWSNAPRERRIFISFARADKQYAARVSESLKQQGYLTFMYIHDSGDAPWTNSVEVGKFFEQSGVKLVVDTDNARRSLGVLVERAALLGLQDGSLRARINGLETLDLEVVDGPGPCCKWCRRQRSGKRCADIFKAGLSNCGPTRCGVFCTHAK